MWKEVLEGDSPTYPVCHLALASSTTPNDAGRAAHSCWKGAPSVKLRTFAGVIITSKKALSKGRTNILGRNQVLLLTLKPVSMQSETLCWYLHCGLLLIFPFCTSVSDLPHQFHFWHLSFFPPRMKYCLIFIIMLQAPDFTTYLFSCISIISLMSFRSTQTGQWFWREKKKKSHACICDSALNLSRLPELVWCSKCLQNTQISPNWLKRMFHPLYLTLESQCFCTLQRVS